MKNKKKNNPFKVNHKRGMKAKSKAQPVKGHLKKLKDIVNKNINTADEKLKDLVEVVRQPSKIEQPKPNNIPKKPNSVLMNAQKIQKYQETVLNTEEALSKLENWSCS